MDVKECKREGRVLSYGTTAKFPSFLNVGNYFRLVINNLRIDDDDNDILLLCH